MNTPSLHEARREFLRPPLLGLDVLSIVKFGGALGLVTGDDDTYTTALEVAGSEGANAAQTARTKVDRVCRSLRECGRLRPLDRKGEDLVAKRPGKRTLSRSEIGPYKA